MRILGKQTVRLPLWLIFALAVITLPRAVVHDLRLLPFDSLLYIALAITPWMIWGAVALFCKTKKPLVDFTLLGAVYGLSLAIAHQILWDATWGAELPRIHGNLQGKLDPTIESIMMRCAAFASSLVTGLVTGLVFGAMAFSASKTRSSLRQADKK